MVPDLHPRIADQDLQPLYDRAVLGGAQRADDNTNHTGKAGFLHQAKPAYCVWPYTVLRPLVRTDVSTGQQCGMATVRQDTQERTGAAAAL